MKISVNHYYRKIDIAVNNELYLSGKMKKKFWKNTWYILNQHNERLIKYTTKSRLFQFNYQLSIESNYKCIILNYKNKRPHIHFDLDNHNYLIVFHVERKFSFYKDDVQFGFMKKIYSGHYFKDQYALISDDGVDIHLLLSLAIALVLINEHFEKDPEYSQIFSWFKELKEFNEYWFPQSVSARKTGENSD